MPEETNQNQNGDTGQDQSQNPSGGSGSGAGAGSEGVNASDWRASLPKELQAEKTFEKFKVGKDETLIPMPLSVAKSYLEAEKTVSKTLNAKGVIVPGENATPEEIKAFRTAYGVPESPDKYEITKPTLPEGMVFDEERAKRFAELAHAEGVPKKAFQQIVSAFNAEQVAEFEAQSKASKEFLDKSTAEIKKEWGSDYDANLKKADEAIGRIFGLGMRKLLTDTGLNAHPDIVRGMFKASQVIGEHALSRGEGALPNAGMTWEKIISMKKDPRYSDLGKRDPAYIKEVDAAVEQYAASKGAN